MYQKHTHTLVEAKTKLEHYCAYQERCHQEVGLKLKRMHMIPEDIDVIMAHLIEHNFLNEERFAKTFVRGKFKIKKWGKRRLTLELKKKDIAKSNIDQAISEINDQEYIEVFNNLVKKKLSSIQESNTYKKRKKLADYIIYRGWETHLVYNKINELIP